MYASLELHHQKEVEVSDILESYGIPDPYKFPFNNRGQLISQFSNEPIEEVIIKDNPLGRVEYEAFKKIQKNALTRSSGYILWISPPFEGIYPVSKIVVSEIIFEDNTKKLLNRSIKIGWDRMGSVLTAKELASLSDLDPDIFRSTTDVRLNPIFVDKEKEEDLSIVLKKILTKKAYEMMSTGADFKAKDLFMEAILAGQEVELGSEPLSCPEEMIKKTAFKVFSGETFSCPKCRGEIPSGVGATVCPHCGAKKEDFASNCD